MQRTDYRVRSPASAGDRGTTSFKSRPRPASVSAERKSVRAASSSAVRPSIATGRFRGPVSRGGHRGSRGHVKSCCLGRGSESRNGCRPCSLTWSSRSLNTATPGQAGAAALRHFIDDVRPTTAAGPGRRSGDAGPQLRRDGLGGESTPHPGRACQPTCRGNRGRRGDAGQGGMQSLRAASPKTLVRYVLDIPPTRDQEGLDLI